MTIIDAVPFRQMHAKPFTNLYCLVMDASVVLFAARGPAQLFWAVAFPQLHVHTVHELVMSMWSHARA